MSILHFLCTKVIIIYYYKDMLKHTCDNYVKHHKFFATKLGVKSITEYPIITLNYFVYYPVILSSVIICIRTYTLYDNIY